MSNTGAKYAPTNTNKTSQATEASPKQPAPESNEASAQATKEIAVIRGAGHVVEISDLSYDRTQFYAFLASCQTCNWQSRNKTANDAVAMAQHHIGVRERIESPR